MVVLRLLRLWVVLPWQIGAIDWGVHSVQGFELHPEQWLPLEDFAECKALDVWEARKAACESS